MVWLSCESPFASNEFALSLSLPFLWKFNFLSISLSFLVYLICLFVYVLCLVIFCCCCSLNICRLFPPPHSLALPLSFSLFFHRQNVRKKVLSCFGYYYCMKVLLFYIRLQRVNQKKKCLLFSPHATVGGWTLLHFCFACFFFCSAAFRVCL